MSWWPTKAHSGIDTFSHIVVKSPKPMVSAVVVMQRWCSGGRVVRWVRGGKQEAGRWVDGSAERWVGRAESSAEWQKKRVKKARGGNE
jgi:hypothetical protein